MFAATEWVGRTALGSLNSREVKVEHDSQRMKIFIYNVSGQVVRMIDLRARGKPKKDKSTASVSRSNDKGNRLMMLTVPGEIDVVSFIVTVFLFL